MKSLLVACFSGFVYTSHFTPQHSLFQGGHKARMQGCSIPVDGISLRFVHTHSRFPLHKHTRLPGSTIMLLLHACNIWAHTVQYDKSRTYTPVRALRYLCKHKPTTTRSSLPRESSFPVQNRKDTSKPTKKTGNLCTRT